MECTSPFLYVFILTLFVYSLFKLGTRIELHNRSLGDLDLCAVGRIDTLTGRTNLCGKRAKTNELYLLTSNQSLLDSICCSVQSLLCVCSCQARSISNLLY